MSVSEVSNGGDAQEKAEKKEKWDRFTCHTSEVGSSEVCRSVHFSLSHQQERRDILWHAVTRLAVHIESTNACIAL